MEDTHSEKRVLFALYQSAVSHERKQFKLTLKKRILPYASTPYVTLIEGLILLMDVDVIIPLCRHVYSVRAGL